MPNSQINIFQPREMTQALLEAKRPKTFLRDTFYTPELHSTKVVDIAVQAGKRRLAPFVNPKHSSKMVERVGVRADTYEPPLMAMNMQTTAEEMLENSGSIFYANSAMQNPAVRAAAQLNADMLELDGMISRREEWMCAQALFTGAVSIVGEGVNDTVDFQQPASHKITLSGADLWNTTTANIEGVLNTWKRLISKDSGLTATDVILGSGAADAVLKNDLILKQLESAGQNIVNLMPDTEGMPEGVTYIGFLPRSGLRLWAYDEWYIDDSGTEQEMVPANKVCVLSRQANFKLHYRAIPAEIPVVSSRWVDTEVKKNPYRRLLYVSSGSIAVPHQVNGFVSATVI